MAKLIHYLVRYGVSLVFVSVFAEQIGLPITAVPTLIVAGALSPDSCVRDTEARFERWGMKSLLFAKFVPGFSTVAPPLAGASRKRSTLAFLVYDGIGALLWAGAAVAAGRLFHRQIEKIIAKLENLGWWAFAVIGG